VTAVAVRAPVAAPDRGLRRLGWTLADTGTLTWRNLTVTVRVPETVFFLVVQPIMFVLLFTYVFGGAIHVPGGSYIDYLMPGIFVQAVCFGAVTTGVGLAEDLQKGLIERFRALPMARSAVLGGRTTADLVRNVFSVMIMTGVGYLVGFRVGTNAGLFLAGALLLLLFAWSLGWGFAIVGLSAPNAETAQLMSFPLIFPFTFASSAFVPVSSMPGWLQPFATNQPVSVTVNAARSLMVGGVYTNTEAVWKALGWCLLLLALFVPFAVRKYRKVV
jgi:ABC-2 type transport system permease protein/oleandomycin transport system permease protein